MKRTASIHIPFEHQLKALDRFSGKLDHDSLRAIGSGILQSRQVDTVAEIADVMQRHSDGDMRHDAIHADVLAATVAGQTQERDGLTSSATDLKEDYAKFLSDVDANIGLGLPDQLKAKLSSLREDVVAYDRDGVDVINCPASAESWLQNILLINPLHQECVFKIDSKKMLVLRNVHDVF